MPHDEDTTPGSSEGLRPPAQAQKTLAREHIKTVTRRRAPVDRLALSSGKEHQMGQLKQNEATRETQFEPQGTHESQFLSPWCA
jgi:hypothetical protein